jgi:hypothetical protein
MVCGMTELLVQSWNKLGEPDFLHPVLANLSAHAQTHSGNPHDYVDHVNDLLRAHGARSQVLHGGKTILLVFDTPEQMTEFLLTWS